MARTRPESFATFAATRVEGLLHLALLLTADEAQARLLVAGELARLKRRWRRTDPFAADLALRSGLYTAYARSSRRSVLRTSIVARRGPVGPASPPDDRPNGDAVSSTDASTTAAVSDSGMSAPATGSGFERMGFTDHGTAESDVPDVNERLWNLIRALSPAQRLALVAEHLDELSPDEIGELAGRSPARVRRDLGQADDRVRAALWTATDGAPADLHPPVRAALLDPRWRLTPEEDLEATVTATGARQRAHRRSRARVAVAAVLVVVLAVAIPVAIGQRRDSALAERLAAPAADSGLLPWPTRGDLASDVTLLDQAQAVWQRAEAGAPTQPHPVFAGRIGDGRVVLLQGRDQQGLMKIAQIEDRGQPGVLTLGQVDLLPAPDVEALTITYSGNLDPALGLSPGEGARLLSLLLAPRWTPKAPRTSSTPSAGPDPSAQSARAGPSARTEGSAPNEQPALQVLLRSPYATSDEAAELWRTMSVNDQGLTRTWLQPERTGAPWDTLVRLADTGATPVRVATIGVRGGQLAPTEPLVQQLPDADAGGLAPPAVIDDVILAQDELARVLRNRSSASDFGAAASWISPLRVRALADVSWDSTAGASGGRAALLDVELSGGGHVNLFVLRRGADVVCLRASPADVLPTDSVLVADSCLLQDSSRRVLVAMAWSKIEGAGVQVQAVDADGGRVATATVGSNRITAVTIELGADDPVRLTWLVYRAQGEAIGGLGTTVLRAGEPAGTFPG